MDKHLHANAGGHAWQPPAAAAPEAHAEILKHALKMAANTRTQIAGTSNTASPAGLPFEYGGYICTHQVCFTYSSRPCFDLMSL